MSDRIELTSGLTGGNHNDARHEYVVPASEAKAGKCVRYIEVSANRMFGCPDENSIGWAVPKQDLYYEVGLSEVWLMPA